MGSPYPPAKYKYFMGCRLTEKGSCVIINAESLALQAFGTSSLHALRGCVTCGLAKVFVQTHTFASWLNRSGAEGKGGVVMRKWIDRVFVIVLLLFLLFSFGRAMLQPTRINEYENRAANQFPSFAFHNFKDGSFQEGVADALSDQVPFALDLKRNYNNTTTGVEKWFMQRLLDMHLPRYINFSGLTVFGGDYITYRPRKLRRVADKLDAKRENYNAAFAAHPEIQFYVYYIEKDTDINFATGKKPGIWDYFKEGLTLPDSSTGCFSVNSFEEYSPYFYKTDHHWNNVGSYKGYEEVTALLGIPARERIPHGDAVLVQRGFFGSKASKIGSESFVEDFYAYDYDYAPLTITVNGEPVEDYGAAREFYAGSDTPVKYGTFYGGDFGEIVFTSEHTDRGNLLVIGESYDNAILKLLASHFDQTFSVDLRAYERDMGAEFSLSAYLEAHDIDKVLLIGNIDFFLKTEFMLRG